MATRAELLELVKNNPERAVDLLLELSQATVVPNVSPHNTPKEIIDSTINTVHTGLDVHDVPDISGKLSKNLDKLVQKLKHG